MNATEETQLVALQNAPEVISVAPPDRRADVEAKHALIASWLPQIGCEGLLVLTPENFAWLTAGGVARGLSDPNDAPALYFSPEGRWLVSANVDSQRVFDEEIDGLGFQLKEWPWHWGREQLLSDLCQGRQVACDQPFLSCKVHADWPARERRTMSDYERACYRAVGQVVSHALEATCRTLQPGDTEREVAGQLAHRVLHRGATATLVSVAADGRGRFYRRGGFTSAPVTQSCVLTLAARKYGLIAQASRSIVFGAEGERLRRDHDAACKVSATYIASSWPDSVPKQILATTQRIYTLTGNEHEWLLAPQGHVTGRAAVEMPLMPNTEELLQNHWAVTWGVSVGEANSCDTFLISEDGPRALTAVETWPLKRIRIQGAEFVRPDVLVR
jgi:hypothetical protein